MPECKFIGKIRTPYKTIEECPRYIQTDGPICTLELEDAYVEGLMGLDRHKYIHVLYWLDKGQRDLLLQTRRRDNKVAGVFALRSPSRPNPIGLATVRLIEIIDNRVIVKGMDCVDGTALLDIKPARTLDAADDKVAT